MTRIVQFAKAGGPEVLEFVDASDRALGASEVRIKVKAIGINRAESMWRTDMYIEPVQFPAGLLSDMRAQSRRYCSEASAGLLLTIM